MRSRRLRRLSTYAGVLAAGAIARWREREPVAPRGRLVFTITNGRSGSEYLAKLLDSVGGVVATHEPAPYFQDLLHDVQRRPRLARDFLLTRKLPAIAALDADLYVETSHLFGKGYFDAMLSLDAPFGLIVLRRDPVAVAHSMHRLGSIPERTKMGRYFYLGRDDENLTELRMENPSDLDLCLWHARETEARQEAYARRAREKGLTVFETSLERLNARGEAEALLAAFGVAPTPQDLARLEAARGTPRNARPCSTRRVLALDEARERMRMLDGFVAPRGAAAPAARSPRP